MRKCFLFVFLTYFLNVFSQEQEEGNACPQTDNKEAIKSYEKGIDRKNKKEERMVFLEKALALEPDYLDAIFAYAKERIVTIKLKGGTYKAVEEYFLKIIELCPSYHSDPYYYLGFSYYEQENNLEAIKYLQKFIDFSDDDHKKFSKDYDAMLGQAKELVKYSKIYEDLIKLKNNPVPFDPRPVQKISTKDDEYLPIISPDNELAFFTKRMQRITKNSIPGMTTDKMVEIFSFSKRGENDLFDEGEPMPTPPFNMHGNEGGATISIDNKHLYYTICRDEGGSQMNCDIYYSHFADDVWTEVQKMEGINDPVFWDSQPSMAADGKTLYFSSDRKGGFGGTDIYKTVLDATSGKWSNPVNMGPKINTAGNEKSPFMHSDSETLYFSSDGHPGFGNYDIFYIRKNEKGEWSVPKNIGYPINTEAEDIGFFVSTDGKYGYFASNNPSRVKGKSIGGYDIYSFDLYKEARPEAVAFIKGTLKAETGEAITGAEVEIKSVDSKEKTEVLMDTTTGEYAAVVNLKKKEDFIVTVRKKGYAFNSEVVAINSIDTVKSKPLKIDFDVKSIEVGKIYVLNNIYYETNSADLKKESRIVIDEFVNFLKENPPIKIEVHGHTDNVGDDRSNMTLSNERAYTVYDLLLEKGIPQSRLKAYQGFGETKPIAGNDTEQGRAKNRRTEFVIIEK